MLTVATTLGDHLARAGEVAGGGIALGGTAGLVVGAIINDLERRDDATGSEPDTTGDVDRWELATRGAVYGGTFGVTVAIIEGLPWS